MLIQQLEYRYNDGGRWIAGYQGSARDCVARALAILTGEPYKQVYRDLARANGKATKGPRSARNGVSKRAYVKVFETYRLRKVKLPKGPRPTFTEAYAMYGSCIVSTAGHLAALVEGALQDTFDGRAYGWPTGNMYCHGCLPDESRGLGGTVHWNSDLACYACGVTGVQMHDYMERRERKAQSVWIQ